MIDSTYKISLKTGRSQFIWDFLYKQEISMKTLAAIVFPENALVAMLSNGFVSAQKINLFGGNLFYKLECGEAGFGGFEECKIKSIGIEKTTFHEFILKSTLLEEIFLKACWLEYIEIENCQIENCTFNSCIGEDVQLIDCKMDASTYENFKCYNLRLSEKSEIEVLKE